MQYSNEYRLESAVNKHGKKYSVLESVSLSLKIAALLLLIIFFRYFYIAIAVWILSIIVNFFKRNLIFRYVYKIQDGRLQVIKEYDVQKFVICAEADIGKDVISYGFSEPEGERYYGENDANILVVRCAEKTFSITADTYFYALIDYYMRGKK